jgi:hypothetical protein
VHRVNRENRHREREVFEDDFFSRPMESVFGRGGLGFGRSIFEDDPFFSHDSIMNDFMSRPFGSSYSNSSSSITRSGGPGGVYYSSTTTVSSANGVTETTHAVQDSRTGTEKVAVKRSIGDKSSTVEKVRDREGREQTTKRLENVMEDEERTFDQDWNHKSSHLPNWGRPHANGANSLMSSTRNNRSSVRAIENQPSRTRRTSSMNK